LTTKALYESFDVSILTIQKSRIDIAKQLHALNKKKENLEKLQSNLQAEGGTGETPKTEALKLYEQILNVTQEIKQVEQVDLSMDKLASLVKQERELYFVIGMDFINKKLDDTIQRNFLSLIKLNEHRYSSSSPLEFLSKPETVEEQKQLRDQILEEMDKKLAPLEKNQTEANQAEIQIIKKLKDKLDKDTAEAWKLRDQQKDLLQKITEHTKEN